MNTKKYNGWKNYETWNVMLWISNTEGLYYALLEIREEYKLQNKKLSYRKFIQEVALDYDTTGDGVKFLSYKLAYRELSQAIQEVA